MRPRSATTAPAMSAVIIVLGETLTARKMALNLPTVNMPQNTEVSKAASVLLNCRSGDYTMACEGEC